MIFYLVQYYNSDNSNHNIYDFAIDISDSDPFIHSKKIQEIIAKWNECGGVDEYGNLDIAEGYNNSGIKEYGCYVFHFSSRECIMFITEIRQCFIDNGFFCGPIKTNLTK